MKNRTPEEMAEHVRAAIKNANGVIKEAESQGYTIDLSLHSDNGVYIKVIKIAKTIIL